MRQIDEDIRNGTFSKLYLLYGDEDYLKRLYKRRLTAAMGDPSDSMNYTYAEGRDINIPAVIDMAETMPFFAERRLIVIENSGFFKNSCEELCDYLKEPADTCSFIFVEKEVDKRSRLYKLLRDNGRVVELTSLSESDLLKWAAGILKKEDKSIRTSTLQLLIERVGTDMFQLYSELIKLSAYVGNREVIEDKDVLDICVHEVKNQVFDMIEAMSKGQAKKAIDLYCDLLTLKEPPMRILFLIVRQFNLLLQAKELTRTIRETKQIAARLSLPPFIAGKYIEGAKKYSRNQLVDAINECALLEQEVKMGKLSDRISVELLIIKFASAFMD